MGEAVQIPFRGEVPSESVLRMKVGSRLWQELSAPSGRPWWQRLQGLHQQLLEAYGVPLPSFECEPDSELPECGYRFRLLGGAPEEGIVHPGRWFAVGAPETVDLLMGEHGQEPVYGLEGRWIPWSRGAGAEQLGCHLLSPEALWVGHLSQRLEMRLPVCLCPQWLQRQLSRRGLKSPGAAFEQTLGWLLEERVSIAPLERIVASYRAQRGDGRRRLQSIRRDLGSRLLAPWLDRQGVLGCAVLSQEASQRLGRELASESGVDPWFLGLLLGQLQAELDDLRESCGEVALVLSGDLRRALFELLPFGMRRTPLLAYEEIPAEVDCQTLAVVGSRLHPCAQAWPRVRQVTAM